MSTKKGKGKGHKKDKPEGAEKSRELGRKEYERELRRLHVELVKLQRWVVHSGLTVLVVFEGRDGAGKGGTIKALTERVSPRVFRTTGPGWSPSWATAQSKRQRVSWRTSRESSAPWWIPASSW
jgi:polyphosphate kinase 2 (PPK2 family)